MDRFLDFYRSIDFIPTGQANVEWPNLYNRRIALYRDLGISIPWLKGRRVIEFGPGGGYNAQPILYHSPSSYHFVDGMRESLAILESVRSMGVSNGVEVKFFHSLFQEFRTENRYDLVIAEACLPGQDNPEKILKLLINIVDSDGILVITNTSKVSLLSEILRSVLAMNIQKLSLGVDDHLNLISDFFESHIRTLPGAVRTSKEWVLDNIFHTWHEGKSDFSFVEVVPLLEDSGFIYIGGSPSFYQDFTWYKDPRKYESRSSSKLIEQYNSIEIFLLDYRIAPTFKAYTILDNDNLIDALECARLCFDAAKLYLKTGDITQSKSLVDRTESLIKVLPNSFNITKLALQEFVDFINLLPKSVEEFDFRHFSSWWGRGQQYNSFQKLTTKSL